MVTTDTKQRLVDALNPNAMKVSPKFTAMLGFFLDRDWTTPKIVDMAITSDGFVMIGTTDDPFLNEMAGEANDLDRNLRGVATAAGLSDEDAATLISLAYARMTDWRRPSITFTEVTE